MNVSYSEIPTSDFHKSYLQKFWVLNNLQNPLCTPSSYALPNGCCTIAFISGNGVVFSSAGKTMELPAGAYLSGQITERASLSLKPFSKAIMAQVKPWLPPIIIGISMDEMVDHVINLRFINCAFNQHFTDIDLSKESIVLPAFLEAPSRFDRSDYILPLTGHFDFLQL